MDMLSSHTLLKALKGESLHCSDTLMKKSISGTMNHNSKLDNTSLSKDSNENSNVLRVSVEKKVYPVTIDILYEVFSRAGKILKISMIEKKENFQALIQYANPVIATIAKLSLDGTHIYNGCCLLRIESSKLH